VGIPTDRDTGFDWGTHFAMCGNPDRRRHGF
jgi:hypothetical protein